MSTNFDGPIGPKDVRTVLTQAFDSVTGALRISNVAPPTLAAATLATAICPEAGTIALGDSANFDITEDVDGNPIPDSIYIPQIIVVPSVATMFRTRLFAASTRLFSDPIWYNYPFGGDEDFTNDVTGFWYMNRDGALPNTIFGEMAIDAAGASAAFFRIFILFLEGV